MYSIWIYVSPLILFLLFVLCKYIWNIIARHGQGMNMAVTYNFETFVGRNSRQYHVRVNFTGRSAFVMRVNNRFR